MTAQMLARQLFAPPGDTTAHTRHLLAQAASSHARLLDSTVEAHQAPLDHLRDSMSDFLRGPASAEEKRFVLDDPQFIETLHSLSAASHRLTDWDATVAPDCFHAPPEQQAALSRGRLGNVVAGVRWRRCRNWCGQMELATDGYGRVHFPFCDWALILLDETGPTHDLLTHARLTLNLDEQRARWTMPDSGPELVAMPRTLFNAMFIDNRSAVPAYKIEFAAGACRVRFERASRVSNTRVRFEPIAREAPAEHAQLTGGIVRSLLAAMRCHAPRIHRQLCQCIRTIHGFELPSYGPGQIASFSLPSSPGVIGFNVPYTRDNVPCLDPFCFMWLGHELGHTLHYLIDDVAFAHGWRFLENPGDITPTIPRYGRGLGVRTLFQIPYAHLFEWSLLMQFQEHHFAGLPWQIRGDAVALGNDVRHEIQESFELIAAYARLTVTGRAVVDRLRELTAEVDSRWRHTTRAAA